MKSGRWLAALSLVVIAVIVLAACGGDPQINTGKRVFAANCAQCHGRRGQGTSGVPALNKAELLQKDDAFFEKTITKGRLGTRMPAWEGRLTDEEIKAVIAFLRTLQR